MSVAGGQGPVNALDIALRPFIHPSTKSIGLCGPPAA